MRRALALSIAISLVGCAQRPSPAPGQGVAAVAYRDAVPTWQRLGTRAFAKHELDGTYDALTYLQSDDLGPAAPMMLHAALERALRENRAVDLFLFVNGGSEALDAVRELAPELRAKLRLVYNTGGGGAWQASEWHALGAKAYLSHPGSGNLAPFFVFDFLRNWSDGQSLSDAVAHSNTALHHRLSGFTAPWILSAAGFNARTEDLPYWEEATRAQITGDDSVVLR
ncbi:MAG: hypothetical protein JST54_06755 [Deltaproteobacteria bacterium]|nr:hypothetical protein [Deltaproteobacteria bacterium]